MDKIYKIAVTGPESTGKTWLAKNLAKYYNTVWVPEYAREYLNKTGGKYHYEDILKIAKGQKKSEEKIAGKANRLLFTDTDLLVTKIWSHVVFNKVDPWIINELTKARYDFYLLCYPDLPWESDPLRENPDDRDKLFDLYKKELDSYGFNYGIVNGQGQLRLENAIILVNGFLNSTKI